MRAITFNLWHGLSPSNVVMFEPLEPAGRRALRESNQIELLRSLAPDLCFFQEVNPVTKRSADFRFELGMDAVLQPDLVGLKLFGLGLPLNLNSGLVTMAKRSFGLRFLEGVSLSRPGRHLVHTWGSWQLKEERFALFSEAMVPNWGRVLLVDTHLHHGLESTPEFDRELAALSEELELSPKIFSEIRSRMAAGSERRQSELRVLLEAIQRYERRFEVILIGGDFNASPESHVGQQLEAAGFKDLWAEVHPEGGGLSYDGTKNVANHLLQSRFPLTLVVEDLSFSLKTKDALLKLARRQEERPRRIDYLWARGQSLRLKVEKAELIGWPDPDGFAVSDHFGVCVDLDFV